MESRESSLVMPFHLLLEESGLAPDNPCRFNWSMQHPSYHFDLTMLFKGPNPWGCSSLLPKQDAFSLHLSLRTILALGIPELGISS